MYFEPGRMDYDAIKASAAAPFQCKHEHVEPRRKEASDGSISVRRQCLRCGCKIEPGIPKKSLTPAQLAALPMWDTSSEKEFNTAKQRAIDEAIQTARQKSADAWKRHYEIYLASEGWFRRRDAVIAREHGVCEGCGGKATEVHHLTYSDLGNEFLFQLVALCKDCHARWHARRAAEASDPNMPD